MQASFCLLESAGRVPESQHGIWDKDIFSGPCMSCDKLFLGLPSKIRAYDLH